MHRIRKRIFIFSQVDESQKYGVGKYVSELTIEARKKKDNFQLIVVEVGVFALVTPLVKKNKNILYFKIPKIFLLKDSYQIMTREYSVSIFCLLNDFFAFSKKDVIHFNSTKQHYLIDKFKKKTNSFLIYTVHVALWKVLYNNSYSKFILDWKNKDHESKSIRNVRFQMQNCELSDRIICLSNEMKKDIIKLFYIPKDKIRIIYNGISLYDKPNSNKHLLDLRKSYNLKEDDFIFTFIGRLIEQKGIDILIESVKRVVQAGYTKSKLLIIGDSFDKSYFNQIKGEEKHVVFAGYVQPDQINDFYHLSDTLILPSMNEQNSYVILEGMSNKIPMIVSEIEAFDWLEDGVHCLKTKLHNNGKAIDIENLVNNLIILLKKPKLRTKLSEKAYELFIKNFSSKRMFEQTYFEDFPV